MNTIEIKNSLDLNLNKDDLMEMLIDEQLTVLENQLADVTTQKEEVQHKINEIKEKDKLEIQKKILKLLPSEFKSFINKAKKIDYSYRLSYSIDNNSYYNLKVIIDNLYTIDILDKTISYNSINIDKLNNQFKELSNKITEINAEITRINTSGKRIKAKMLKAFLNNSKEGKDILKLMGKSDIKLLA